MKQTSFVRSSALSLILGALLQLVLGTIQHVAPVWPPSLAFSIRNSAIALSHLLVLIGVIGLARTGAAGNGWLGKIGLGIAIVGGILFIPSELLIQFNQTLGSNLDGMCAMLLGLGLVLAGIAVIRARQWQGWHRVMPLLTGLYVFLVIFPAFAITKGPNFLALAGWGVPALLFGIALRAEPILAKRAAQATQLASAR